MVVIFQYSPSLSPFDPPVSSSTLDPSSSRSRQVPLLSSRTSAVLWPFQEMVPFCPAQHSSPELATPSLAQALYDRSIKPGL